MIVIIWLALQLLCVITPALSQPGSETDRLALLEFKAGIDRDPLGILNSWNDSTPLCSWPGLSCDDDERVVAVELPARLLEGRLSPHIGNLSFLRRLDLANNGFGPDIPPELGRLSALQVLNFRNNSFAGEIPANISGCKRLQFLGVHFNGLDRRLPKEIGSLSELRTLQFSGNKLVGEIPASLGNLSLLSQFYLANNRLRGSIPSSLSRLRNVKIFSVAINNLTGTVPLSIYNMSSIEVFGIHANRLEGTLPTNLGLTLPNLTHFSIVDNHFFGSIPITLSNASNLVVLQIQHNNFTGKIPSFKSSLNLTRFGMSYNNLGSGENGDFDFINDLVNCSMLEGLGVVENNLGGEIPESIGNMTSTRLREMAFGRNRISGKIPTGIGNLVSLERLGFEENRLTGPIPGSIGKLRKMVALALHENKISGSIPSSIGNLTSLIRLSLGRNNIEGNIPSSFGLCRNLQVLTLPQNNLSGTIPPQLVSLSSLTQYLDLSENQLTGSIPEEVGRLVSLGGFDISENKISGEIPKTLGSCLSLEYLYLQGNFLQGSIPEELDTLRGLRVIDLSRNNLSGQVPAYFADFRGLEYLNLSFNGFEGRVPPEGIYKNASRFSVAGNTRLCGGSPELELPFCDSNSPNKNKLSTRKKIFIIVACVIVGLSVTVLLVVFTFFRSRKRSETDVEPLAGVSLPRVSYGELSNATDGFSSENLLGAGGFGSVYKGVLNQERCVAVKVLNLHISRALKSFVAECESLGTIRHRNLVKILTICSSIDLKGNDFKAIVYEFVENGNLEEWLHSGQTIQERRHRSLNLFQRIDIAIDVASALDYLHNHGPEVIAHCDIKPSNILLDGQMVARVGDFGLAKLLKSTFSDQSSSVGVRGTIGYVAPEYATGSKVSTLGDIYSYGILLLEMFTGKRPSDAMFKDDFDLHNFASMALPERISEVVDPMLRLKEEEEEEDKESSENGILGCDDQDQAVQKCLISIIEIGIICSSKFPGERRNMSDVANELRRIREVLFQHRIARNPFPTQNS